MNPLRILYIDTERFWRGGQEQLFTLIRGMKERGHQVMLAAPSDAPLSEKTRDLGVATHDFVQRHELSPLAYLRLRRLMGDLKPALIHFNTPRPILVGSRAARTQGVAIRVCSRRVNFPLRTVLSRYKSDRLLDAIVTVSESIRETLLEGGVRESLIHVIYEGVDLDWIDSLRPPGVLPEGTSIVGIVAHLSPEKGHDTLLRAARRLVGRFPETRFVLVGEGQLKAKLVEDATRLGLRRQVIFTGFRSDSEALMKEFDIFCLPSLSEGLSSAILAAMASSLPVIATRVGGIPELVIDGKTGYLVPPDDPESLATALTRVLSSRGLRKELGAAGRARVETHFTLQRKLDRSESLYRRLIENRKPR